MTMDPNTATAVKADLSDRWQGPAPVAHLQAGVQPPHAADLEQAVIGACLLVSRRIREVQGTLSPAHFYQEAHQRIWAAMLDMDREHRQVDILTVSQELRKRGELDRVGGAYYLSQLSGRVSSDAHVMDHAGIVAGKYTLREIIRIGEDAARAAQADRADAARILSMAYDGMMQLAGSVEGDAPAVPMSEIHARMVDDRQVPELVRLGLGPLDECVALAPGDNTIIGARPSVGKTAVALSIARAIAEQGHKVAMVSLEMSGAQLTARVSSSISEVDSNRITINSVNEQERDRMAAAGARHGGWMERVLVVDLATLTGDEVPGLFARLARLGVKAAIIDYIQKMDGTGDSYRVIIDKISKRIKQSAKRTGIRSITLSQLKRRDGADEDPVMSDLLESGGLEADGDNIILLGRKRGESILKVDLAKNKFGPIGFWYLHFDLSHQRIGGEAQRPGQEPPPFNPGIPASAGHRELPPENDDTPF